MKRYLLHTISFLPLFAQLTRVIVPTTVVGDLREAHDERGCPHGSPVDERTPRIPTALSAQKKFGNMCVVHTCMRLDSRNTSCQAHHASPCWVTQCR